MGIRNLVKGTLTTLVLSTDVVSADDVALFIGNETYRNFNSVPSAKSVLTTSEAFASAGYDVIRVADGTEAQMKNALDRFETPHGDADRVVVVLSGHFMHATSETWFAPADLQSPSFANVGFDALPLSAVLSFLAEKSGGAALFLATQENAIIVDASIQKGVGAVSAPQGVMVAQGSPNAVRKALSTAFLAQDLSLSQAAQASPDLTVSGFVSDLVSLNGADGASGQEDDVVDLPVSDALAEEAF